MRVLVTGATGFIGAAVVRSLVRRPDVIVRAAIRHPAAPMPSPAEVSVTGNLGPDTDWSDALRDVDVVVHTAARVHVMRERSADPLSEFRRTNVEGTLTLARQAAHAGARRFIFLSSVKVNGEETSADRPYRATDIPAPSDAYGISKAEAERALSLLGRDLGLEIVIIRPVLVYGPGVRGNFLSMLRWMHRSIPLPFGAIDNRRSLVAIDNVVDLVAATLTNPAAANRTFLVSDGEDLSTTELLNRTGAALGARPRLFHVPPAILTLLATLLGRRDVARRLCGTLQVDISDTCGVLAWSPPVRLDDALDRTAREFLDRKERR